MENLTTTTSSLTKLSLQQTRLTAEMSLREFVSVFVELYKSLYEEKEINRDVAYAPDEVEEYVYYELDADNFETYRYSIEEHYLSSWGVDLSILFYQGRINELRDDFIALMYSVAVNSDWFPKQSNGEYFDKYQFK